MMEPHSSPLRGSSPHINDHNPGMHMRSFARLILTFSLAVACLPALNAQINERPKYNNIWYWRYVCGLDFNNSPPSILLDGPVKMGEGQSMIADPDSGELLLLFDGYELYRGREGEFSEGHTLFSSRTAMQGSVITPLPGSKRYYYIFHTDGLPVQHGSLRGLFYTVVDVEATTDEEFIVQENVLIDSLATERVAATWNCDGNFFWIVSRQQYGNRYLSFKLTAEGVDHEPVVSNIGPTAVVETRNHWAWVGGLYFSPGGKHLAMTTWDPFYNTPLTPGIFEIFEFNMDSGELTQSLGLTEKNFEYNVNPHVAFSPDGTKCYLSGSWKEEQGIIQLDLSLGDGDEVFNRRTVINSPVNNDRFVGICDLQLAPDGKIYFGTSQFESSGRDQWIGVIRNPNAVGKACDINVNEMLIQNAPYACSSPPNQVMSWNSSVASDLCMTPDVRIELSDSTICQGECIDIRDASLFHPDEWSWTIEHEGDVRSWNVRNPGAVCFPEAGEYTIRLVGLNKWGANEDRRTVLVYSAPVADAGSDVAFCLGGAVQLNADVGDGTFVWSPDDETIDDVNSRTPTVNPSTSRWYYLDVVSTEGCAARDSVFVRVDPRPTVNIVNKDIELCAGESIQLLSAARGGELHWTPDDEFIDDVNSLTPTVNPPTSRWYFLDVIASEGCTARDSVFVRVTELPTVEIIADRLVVCPGEEVQLRVLMSEVERFAWDNPEEFDDPMSPAPTVRPDKTSRYTITVWKGICRAEASIEITVNEALELNIDTPAAVCAGEEIELHADVPSDATLQWTPAELFNDPGTANPRVRLEESQWVYLYADRDGCSAYDSTFVEVFPQPDLTLSAPPRVICRGATLRLEAAADRPGTIAWTPAAGLDDATSFTPSLTLNNSRTLTATFTSEDGCQSIEEITLEVSTPEPTGLAVSIDEEDILPGDRITWRLTQTGGRGFINSINLDLVFPQEAVRIIQESVVTAPGWSFTLTPNVSGGLLNIQGEGPPTEIAELLQWQTHVLLVELNKDGIIVVEPSAMTLTSDSDCFAAGEPTSDELQYSPYCLGNSRLLTIGAGAFALHAPQPNPVGSGATVRFELGFDSHALLQVFNTLGEVVDELASGRMTAGEHEVQLPPDMAGGLYMLRLQAGPYVGTQTVIVNK